MDYWLLVCPAEDASSARKIDGALVAVLEHVATQLGLRRTTDRSARKIYLGLPVVSAAPKPVPVYYSQRDSRVSKDGVNQAHRMCFSSSAAMLLKAKKPNALSDSPNADDEYLQRVFQFGDTTSVAAQLSALSHFGVAAHWRDNMDLVALDAHLAAGGLAALGILHQGHVSRPSGGGHYLVVYDRDGDGYKVHDPNGELDLVNGGYVAGSSGRGLTYSRQNLSRRWQIEGPKSGWALLVD